MVCPIHNRPSLMATISRAPGRYVLGFDVGTSAVKAALFERDGRLAATAQHPFALHLPAPGHAEQHPQDWWAAMGLAAREAMARAGALATEVSGIGIAAQMCGLVAVDAQGTPLHPCLIWLDTRSQPQARALTAGGPRVAGYGLFMLARWLRLANGAPNLGGKDPTSKMVWLREQRPDLWPRVHRLLDVRDWLVHRLTGEFVTGRDSANLTWLMDTRDGREGWSAPLLRHAGIDAALLPRIAGGCEPAGTLTPEAAAHLGLAAGTVVSTGAGDLNAYALAAGSLAPDAWHLHVGTSSWLGCTLPRRRVAPLNGIATICSVLPQRHLLIATQESAGSAVAWAARTLGFGDGADGLRALDEAAAAGRPEAAPLFLPWLHGERVPVDDAALRGALMGLSLATRREDVALGLLAGVAQNIRWAWSVARPLAEGVRGPLRLLGGACRSALWPQVIADVLGHPVAVMAEGEWGGARGAALTAAVACGWHDSAEQAAGELRIARTVEPDPRRAAWADERHAAFVAAHRATRGWFSRHGAGEHA